MQLFVFITSHGESISPMLPKLMDAGISGATIVDCKGMLAAMEESGEEPPPIFGSLRYIASHSQRAGKMLFAVVRDEDIAKMKDIIHGVFSDLKLPDTGIYFTLPITNWEGVPHK